MDDKAFLISVLEKQDFALLYRALRDQIIAQQKRGEKVPEQAYVVLGKLKIALNII